MTSEVTEKFYDRERLLQNILKLVAENSDFLVEKQLKELLEPYTDKEKMLIKIDSVFTVNNRKQYQLPFPFTHVFIISKAMNGRLYN